MYIDTYSLQVHVQQRAEEVAQEYRSAKFDQAQLVSALGVGLEWMGLRLASWSKRLQVQPQAVGLQPVRISSTGIRR